MSTLFFGFLLVALFATTALLVGYYSKTRYDDEDRTRRDAVAAAALRVISKDLLDISKIRDDVTKFGGAHLGAKFEKLLLRLKSLSYSGRPFDPTGKDVLAIAGEVEKLRLTKDQLLNLAANLWELGYVSYGLPVDKLICDERLLTAILYKLVRGQGFIADPSWLPALTDLGGNYWVFSKNAGHRTIYKSILVIQGFKAVGSFRVPNGEQRNEERAVAIEIVKDLRFENPVVRSGTFVPFNPQSMAVLSTNSEISHRVFRQEFSQITASSLVSQGTTLEHPIKFVCLEKRPNEILRGTFLQGDQIGFFVALRMGGEINDGLIQELGILNDSEVEQLPTLERVAIDQLRSSYDAGTNTKARATVDVASKRVST